MSEGITLKGDFQLEPRKVLQRTLDVRLRLSLRDWALVVYTACLLVALTVLLGALALRGDWSPHAFRPVWPLAALALFAVAVERQSVRLGPRTELSVSFLPIVLAAVIYGPAGAVVVSASSLLLDFGRPYTRWVVWTSTRSLAAACAGIAAASFDGPSGRHAFTSVLAAVVVATLVEQYGDLLFGSVTAALRGMSLKDIGRAASALSLTIPLYVPLTAVLVYVYREVPWSVVLFLIPAFTAQKLFLLYQEQRATSEELAEAIARQERANLSFASALVATLDARDRYTAGHSAAVAIYARDIAERLGLNVEQQRLAHLAGLVHDIGKIGLPPGLLEKAGPLTLSERRQMEQHSVIGERILLNVADYAEVARIVRHHHERMDGRGYPDGLAGEDIPLLSRILAVADAYNAMTSDRPYREAMPSRVARLRMAQAVESQFDTTVVAGFEALLAGAPEDYRAGSVFDIRPHSEIQISAVAATG